MEDHRRGGVETNDIKLLDRPVPVDDLTQYAEARGAGEGDQASEPAREE